MYDEKVLEPKKVYDKDFKRLNKIATAKKVTTCIDQYKLRKSLEGSIRIKAPEIMRSTHQFIENSDKGFGRPNRPSTPMNAVMSGLYEAEAAEVQGHKNMINDHIFKTMNQFNGVRNHTRASALAKDHVSQSRSQFLGGAQPKELFKMTQFKMVKSRVGAYHENSRARSAAIKRK